MNKELKKRIISSLIILPISVLIIKQGSILFILFLFFLLSLTTYEWFKMNKKGFFKNFVGTLFFTYSFLLRFN